MSFSNLQSTVPVGQVILGRREFIPGHIILPNEDSCDALELQSLE